MHTHSSFCTASRPRSRDAPTAAPTDPPRPLTTALGHSLALHAVLHLTQSTPDGRPSPDSGETTTISRVWALVGIFLQNRHGEVAPLSWRRSPPEGAPFVSAVVLGPPRGSGPLASSLGDPGIPRPGRPASHARRPGSLTIGAAARLVLAVAAAVEVLAGEIVHDAGRTPSPESHDLGPANAQETGSASQPPPPPPPHNAARRPGAPEAHAKPLGRQQARPARRLLELTPAAPS